MICGMPDSMANTFGEKLKTHRKAAQMSLDALAEAADVSKTYLNNIERGERNAPSREIVKRLASALDWSLREAMTDAGYVYTSEFESQPFAREDTYEPFTEDQQERILDTFKPMPAEQRERVLKMIDLAFPNRPALDDDFTTFGKRRKDEDEEKEK